MYSLSVRSCKFMSENSRNEPKMIPLTTTYLKIPPAGAHLRGALRIEDAAHDRCATRRRT